LFFLKFFYLGGLSILDDRDSFGPTWRPEWNTDLGDIASADRDAADRLGLVTDGIVVGGTPAVSD
jgi:hypothetical protein